MNRWAYSAPLAPVMAVTISTLDQLYEIAPVLSRISRDSIRTERNDAGWRLARQRIRSLRMIPILRLDDETDRQRAESLLDKLRLDPRRLVLETAKDDESVRQILADVARRGDGAIVDSARRFDDPDFTREQIRVTLDEMRDAAAGVSSEQMKSVRRSISQVRRYQSKVMPREQPHFERE